MDWMRTRRVSAGSASARTATTVLGWLAFVTLVVVPSAAQGASGEWEIATETKRSIFSFTRIGQRAKRNANTQILPAATETWRKDNQREIRADISYWSAIRRAEKARFAAIAREQTQRALDAARAKEDADGEFARTQPDPRVPLATPTEGSTSRFVEFPSNEDTSSPQRPRPRNPDKPGTKTGAETKDPVSKIADTIDETFKPGRLSETPRPASFVLALLAVILVPSFAGFLLLVGFLNLRHGYWLRGGTFFSAGLFLSLLIYVTAFHRETISDRQKLLTECRDTSLTITASVLEIDEDGAVLASLSTKGGKTAETDRNGWAFLFTAKSGSISGGEKFTRVVYPVGQKRTRNPLGLAADMPAYTDSLEQAIAYREQESHEANWWQRLMRPLVKG